LKNLRLQQGNLINLDGGLGQFDYIIAHGLFSWVPPAVQDKLLSLCGHLLQPQGVAFISYNTYPGWHMRGIIRDAMLFRTQSMSDPQERYRAAVSVLEFLSKAVPNSLENYGALWKNEVDLMRSSHPSYVLHDHLELCNNPVYFNEFSRRARLCGLTCMADADVATMTTENMPHFAKGIGSLTSDPVETEQYLDFATNRMFRQTLLCRNGITLNRHHSASAFTRLRVACRGKTQGPVDGRSGKPVTFRWPQSTLTTTDQLTIEIYLRLSQRWPRSIPISELFGWGSSSELPQNSADARRKRDDAMVALLTRGLCSGQLEFSTLPDEFVTGISAQPLTSSFSRRSALRSGWVTNRRHESIRLDEMQRYVIRLLDGKHDRDVIVREIMGAVRRGELNVREGGRPLTDESRIQRAAQSLMDTLLPRFAELMLLIG
jgi:methyltransferase-like protein